MILRLNSAFRSAQTNAMDLRPFGNRAAQWLNAGLDLCYPSVCTVCQGDLAPGDTGLCWECLRNIRFLKPPFCVWCGQPVPGDITSDYECQQCTEVPPRFDRARAVGRFSGSLRQAAMALKYRRALWLAPLLGDLMSATAVEQGLDLPETVVCPVPLHPSRFRHRGYNQSEILAKAVSRSLGVPMRRRLLRRLRPTPTQTRLSKPARRANVRGAFEASRRRCAECTTVLLIDDVKTSGATVSECARMLKRAGVKTVNVLTLAHG